MTTLAEVLAKSICSDLRLGSDDRYLVVEAARRFASLDDAGVRAAAATLTEVHRTRPSVAGAVAALAIGVIHGRFTSTLDPAARTAHEESMTGIGTRGGAYDSASSEPEVAEALARAESLAAAGDAGTADAIRRAVEAHQRGGG